MHARVAQLVERLSYTQLVPGSSPGACTGMKVWSNLFFLLPLGLAGFYGLYVPAVVILVSTSVSTLFHLHDEKRFSFADSLCASVLILSNLYLFYLARFSPLYFIPAIFLSFLAFFFFYRAQKNDYELHHSFWHF